jgi:hypothetical protein
MNLADEKVVFIRNSPESWDSFISLELIKAFPNHERIDQTAVICSSTDARVSPEFRKPKYIQSATHWFINLQIMYRFVQSEKNYLFVCDDSIHIKDSIIKKIASLNIKGLILLADTKAYIINRETARIIVTNSYIYYNDLLSVLQDLKNLNLIQLESMPIESLLVQEWH